MKRKIAGVLLVIMVFALGLNYAAAEDLNLDTEAIIERARILEVEAYDESSEEGVPFFQYNRVKLKILSGSYKGQEFETTHILTGSVGYDIIVQPGDKVLVTIDELDDGLTEVYISEYLRDSYVLTLAIIFILLLLLVGRMKGFKTIITLVLTIGLVLKVLLPGLLAGYNPILLTIFISFVITLITITMVGGLNKKSLAAIIGILGGVFCAGLIAYIIGSKVRLTGLSSQEAMMLMYIPQGVKFNFSGLLFAGIILGALGAVMDVGMSIASSIEEIKTLNPNITSKQLFVSGMNVGRDIMGTMANTLILAYTGSAIPLLLLFTAYQESFIKIINLDLIATEIVRALAGSIGLILSIPLTALAAGILTKEKIKIT